MTHRSEVGLEAVSEAPSPSPLRSRIDTGGIRSVVVLFDRPVGRHAVHWLRDHLAMPPGALERRVVRVVHRRIPGTDYGSVASVHELREALHAGGSERDTVLATVPEAAARCDEPATLTVLFDHGPSSRDGLRWACRRARGSTLIVPANPVRRRRPVALLEARAHRDLATLLNSAQLLPPAMPLILRVVYSTETAFAARALRESERLQHDLELAGAVLRAGGRKVRTDMAWQDEPDEAASLVVRVARRGWLRRFGPGTRASRGDAGSLLLAAPAPR